MATATFDRFFFPRSCFRNATHPRGQLRPCSGLATEIPLFFRLTPLEDFLGEMRTPGQVLLTCCY
nr:TPA_asm: m126-m128 uORF RNA 1 [Murid betaherpesvirus 1]DBA07905.1 TPA_asm: m126-m128 uORF RNA 1 [Murid betaherpesvirus 1]